MAGGEVAGQSTDLFENPFHIEDLQVFDEDALSYMLCHNGSGLSEQYLAPALQSAPADLIKRIVDNMSESQRTRFIQLADQKFTSEEVVRARQLILDSCFWELIYWKTPEFYEELTEGERLHPAIFERLAPDLAGKTILDVGAGSGRASLECIRYGAERVYAIDPSPGLLRILKNKLPAGESRIIARSGRFDDLPEADQSVDIALSCSAFTSEAQQGGEAGLAELKRVTRPGGKIIIIWPRREDHKWLQERGFQYVALPVQEEMCVSFRSVQVALHCARLFYAHNERVLQYIRKMQKSEIPFSVIGINPPRDYYWLELPERK